MPGAGFGGVWDETLAEDQEADADDQRRCTQHEHDHGLFPFPVQVAFHRGWPSRRVRGVGWDNLTNVRSFLIRLKMSKKQLPPLEAALIAASSLQDLQI